MFFSPASASDLADIQHLLDESELPTADITPELLERFVVRRENDILVAVGGLEMIGENALLRSCAVSRSARKSGLGGRLVAALETLAYNHGIQTLYLLTTTAAAYFAKLGYSYLTRDAAPEAIRQTQQFSALCPASSSFMAKQLTVPLSYR